MNTTCWEVAPAVRAEESDARRLCVTAAELAAAIEDNLGRFVASAEENLGHLETQLAHQAQELLRQAAETGAQKKADATPPVCPKCQRTLTRQAAGHPRTFTTRFGEVTVRRTRGLLLALPQVARTGRHGAGLGGERRLLAGRAGNDRAFGEQDARQ